MALGSGIPAVIGVIYFVINFIGVIWVMFHMYGKSAFNAMCNYFWKRRVVFLSLTVYFLDTATDIVVLITWCDLMIQEQNGTNFESIDMRTFFWPGVSFVLLYNILLLFSNCDSKHKWDVLLTLIQLYPFRAMWVSLDQSNQFGLEMKDQRSQKVEKQQEVYGSDGGDDEDDPGRAVNVDMTPVKSDEPEDEDDEKAEVEKPTPGNDDDEPAEKQDTLGTPAADPTHEKRNSALVENPVAGELDDHDPTKQQRFMLVLQCVFETVPGLLLQLTFWIKSANDPILSVDADTFLIPFSICVSVVTVTDRFVRYIDDLVVREEFKRDHKMVYITRLLFRMSSLCASLVVFTMLWSIVGGMWIAIWAFVSFLIWLVVASAVEGKVGTGSNLGNAIRNVFALPAFYNWKWHTIKFLENILGMCLVLLFLWTDVEGDLFVSWGTRKNLNTHGRVQFLFAAGFICSIATFMLYLVLRSLNVLKDGVPDKSHSMWSRGDGHVER